MPFAASKLKIERANKHIADLDSRITAFSETDFYTLVVDKDPKTLGSILRVHATAAIPADFSLIIGDAIHNARSALDLAWYEIISTRLPHLLDSHTKFPFKRSRDELIATLEGRKIGEAFPLLFESLVNTIKPYPTGNDSLMALHDLDIADKHRLLLPVMQVGALTGVCLQSNEALFQDCTFVFTGNRAYTPIKVPGDLTINHKGKPALRIFFEKGLPLEGHPVVETLRELANLAGAVVELLGISCGMVES